MTKQNVYIVESFSLVTEAFFPNNRFIIRDKNIKVILYINIYHRKQMSTVSSSCFF